ncbi:MAG TPA: family 16 glycoside hydrolase [Polyangiaceae bacterium]
MAETKSPGVRVLRVCKAGVVPGAAILAITTLGWGCASSNPITGASGASGKEGMTLAGSGGRSGTAVGGAGPGIAGSAPGGAGGGGGTAGLGSGGAAASGAATSGEAGSGGGAAGLSGGPNAGAGGTQGGASGSGGKGSWVEAFNHKDLTNFHSLIHGWKYDDNHYNTFRVDPTTGFLVNSLADYPGGAKGYGGHCGLLYYDQNLTDYRLRIEYQFMPNGDGNNNGGMEVFCQDPSKVAGDPMYAPGLEIQVIAQCTNGCGGGTTKAGDGSNNLSICQPTNVKASTIMGDPNAQTTNCTPGSSAKLPPQAQWVTIECEIHPNSASKCWDCWEGAPTASTPFPGCTPDVTQPAAIAFSGVHDNNGPLKGGYFAAVQSEGQEQAYRTIQVMDLSQ